MKYTEAFKSFWFYWVFLIYSSMQLRFGVMLYDKLYLFEIIAIMVISFLFILFFYTVGFGVIKILEQFTKR